MQSEKIERNSESVSEGKRKIRLFFFFFLVQVKHKKDKLVGFSKNFLVLQLWRV